VLRPWSSNLSGENTKPKSRVDCTKKCAPNLLCEFDFQMRWERLCKFGRLGYGVRLQIENHFSKNRSYIALCERNYCEGRK